jgi:hypothetical protein
MHLVPLPKSLENCVPEYLAVTIHCIGSYRCQKIFVSSGHILIMERAKNRRELSKVNMVHFCNGYLTASCAGALPWWRIHLFGQSSGLFL